MDPTGSPPRPEPERLDDYRIMERLGEGAMGVVYLAVHEVLDRRVALKVIRPERALAETAVLRFRREAEALARISHTNIARVFDCGRDRGVLYLAMEYLPGRSLAQLVSEAEARGEKLPAAEVTAWGRDLAMGLQAAHDAQTVHRDVKPSNVRIADDGRAVLLDFGLARNFEDVSITRSGEFQGTPHYASPEQVAAVGDAIGPPTDIYSLGATLYEAVSGRPPFSGETAEGVFRQILVEEPPSPRRSNPDVPRDLETVLGKAMEKVPGDRYASAGELADDLQAILDYRPIAASPPRPLQRLARLCRRRPGAAAAAGVALLLLASLPLLLLWQAAVQRRAVEEQVVGLIDDTSWRIEQYGLHAARVAELRPRVQEDLTEIENRYLTDEEDREPRARAAELRRAERGMQESVFQALQNLTAAARLLPGDRRIPAKRAELYMAQWRSADPEEQRGEREALQLLVEANDEQKRFADELRATGSLSLITEPPGTEVYLFQYLEHADVVPGGERRLVPVPVGFEPPIPAGSFALRVIDPTRRNMNRDDGGLQTGDLVLEVGGHPLTGTVWVESRREGEEKRLVEEGDRLVSIDGQLPRDWREAISIANAGDSGEVTKEFVFERDGSTYSWEGASLRGQDFVLTGSWGAAERIGKPVLVYHQGEMREQVLPPTLHLRLRMTAAPLFLASENRIGTTPIEAHELPEGSYLALLRREGHEDQRVPFRIRRGAATELSTRLLLKGTSPARFVFVPGSDEAAPFWIQEHEVENEEYLDFLNDPETLAQIRASRQPILYPRTDGGQIASGWRRNAQGGFELTETNIKPVRYVTRDDVIAFARWKTVAYGREVPGAELVFDLPTEDQWMRAARGADGRPFTYGRRFRPHWALGLYSYSWIEHGPFPIVSFPIDESPYGVYDLVGNLTEMCLEAYRPGNEGVGLVKGGAYYMDRESQFRLESRNGQNRNSPHGMVGFRLVATRR